MNFSESFILATAMALDALLVSLSYGLILSGKRFYNAFKFAFMFGFFQFIMPVLGWNFTQVVYSSLEKISHIIVFLVFFVLAVKFLKEAFEKKEDVDITCVSFFCLLSLAVATSIDAFFAGVGIRLLKTGILFPASLIGIITFILSFAGFILASCIKKFPSKNIEIIGAMFLLYLAIKSLF